MIFSFCKKGWPAGGSPPILNQILKFRALRNSINLYSLVKSNRFKPISLLKVLSTFPFAI